MDIEQFYLGKVPDYDGRMLRDIWGWGHDSLEGVHDYIQVLFPLDEPSNFNSRAPVLNEATFARLRGNPEVRANLLQSLRVMLNFYGFRLDEQTCEVVEAENFSERADNWLFPDDHNHLRITRILRCLCLCGLGRYATAFLRRLEQVADPRHVSPESLRFWREAATPDDDPAEDSPVFEPPDWLDREEEVLAPYAMRTRRSRGRLHPEEPHPFRTLYQRDRDRIVHSTAFRRLMYKTQVLIVPTNDYHRTRLTHTLEVAQISRTIARQLGLNEDLTEAVALAHDLGHPPFGHAGETALDECMRDHGGFEHNRHGLRILEELEYRYADFPGLNLSAEVLEAQAWKSKKSDDPAVRRHLGAGQPLLEAQLVDAADSLAYDTHDVDDALNVDLISNEQLQEVEFWRLAVERVHRAHRDVGPLQFRPTVVRALIDWQVTDLLENTRRRLREFRIRTVEDVRRAPELIARPGPEVCRLKAGLEQFLHRCVYRHHRVQRMAIKGRRFLQQLFAEYCRAPAQLPQRYFVRIKDGPPERTVCDYLAGMTDRYAQDEYLRLFHPYSVV